MQFGTTDFYLTCYLTLKGHPIKSIRKISENKLEFIFNKTNTLESQKEQFFWNNAQVDPLLFGGQIKKIKNLIYNY